MHDLHVKQTEKTAAKTKTERLRHFWLVLQRGIVQLQLFKRIAQSIILVRFHWEQTGKDLRLHFLESRQRVFCRFACKRNSVADTGVLQFLDTSNDEADLSCSQRFTCLRFWRKDANALSQMLRAGCHQQNLFLWTQGPVNDAHQHHNTDIIVEPGIDDQRLQRRLGVPLRRRHLGNHGFEHFTYAQASLGRAMHRVRSIDADHLLDLANRIIRVRRRQIDLVQHRHDLDTEFNRGVAVRHGLCLDALRRIDHQQRPFARGKRAANFITEVDMSWSVDQIEVIDFTVHRLVRQRSCLRLDRNTALAFQIHRIKHLRFHFAIRQPTAQLNDSVGQSRLAMVDMGNDGEITNVVH